MSKLYNAIDLQLGSYYEEGITLKEAKETALRFVERAMLEWQPTGFELNTNNIRE